ncbi:mannosyltransferase family protein [Streptomyces yaizuensis]|uniref:Glycosyltransferase family 39 protein n=1 Tax=Streptomyces yaizuensis TaxID=2989713 RepID=A0ABQ5NZX8_9ACTN|nr:mannosyltransferase family protein [Streptomyces sp. YSPA8]GLF95910.1 glycosyltransferase family 39 protein [Streptomyces sp. YSPA8]
MRARRCSLSAETFEDATAGDAAAAHNRTRRLRDAFRRAAPALGLFAAARLTGLLVMAAWAWHIDRPARRTLARSWDSDWYLLIAEHGYGRTLTWPDGAVQSDLAFFPLYPGLVRAVTAVVPVTPGTAGLVVSWVAAGVAAWGIHAVGERVYGRRAATVLVLLWGLLPHSVVLTMAYTEPLLCAFAAWSLYALLTGAWLWAGALSLFAGAARPNGIAVAAAVLVTAACHGVRALRQGRRTGWRPWAGAALAPVGWCAYVLYVGVREGDPLGGYFAVQRRWTSTFDFGAGSLRVVRDVVLRPAPLPLAVTLVIVAAGVVLYALLLLDRPPLPLIVYAGVLVLITVGGSGFFESKPRFLLPAFPLLLPVARALARARPGPAAVVTGALAAVSFAYGTYLLTLSPVAL